MDPVVILATEAVSAGPGGEARLLARVRNQGRRVESYVVEVLGEPSRFCQVEPRSVSVLPGKEAEITITFRPPVGASTPTGALPFGVRAVSEVGSSSSAVAEGRIELAGAAGLQAWADTTTAAGRWSATYRLVFANQGNAPARLFVTAHDPAAAVRLTVRDEVLAVPPGAQVDTEVRVKARQPFLRGNTVNRTITASCQDFPFGAERPSPGQVAPRDDPNHRTFQLTYQQRPILSKLVLALGALLVVALVGLAVLRLRGGKDVVLGLTSPAEPLGFTATAQGSTSILLSWDPVPNAAGYDIRTTTPEGALSGEAVASLDGATRNHLIDGLAPNTQHCYAVVATGPEGVDASAPSAHACATTTAPSAIEAPVNLLATPAPAGVFELTWEHSLQPDDVSFSIYVNAAPFKEGIVDATRTDIELEVKDVPYTAQLTVYAVVDGQRSEPSNQQEVTVDAGPPVAASSVPSGPGPGGSPTTAPSGGATTTTPSGATTTTATATTTTTTVAAQSKLRDLEGSWAAYFVSPIQPSRVGAGEEADKRDIAADFGIPVEAIQTLSNRDTQILEAVGDLDDRAHDAPAATRFFYVPNQLDQTEAERVCSASPQRCVARIVEGAANAAEGTSIIVLDLLAATSPLTDVDTALDAFRERLGYRNIYVLDGAERAQFDTDELVVYASGFVDETARASFCAAARLDPCEPVLLAPD